MFIKYIIKNNLRTPIYYLILSNCKNNNDLKSQLYAYLNIIQKILYKSNKLPYNLTVWFKN